RGMTDRTPDWIIVGRIRKAHGIRGEVLVEPITDAPDAIFAPGRRVFVGLSDARPDSALPPLEVRAARPFKEGFLIVFDAVHDRDDAERWRDRWLFLAADELPGPDDGEIYLHDIPGMRVELEDGTVVGTVGTLYELPQGLVMDVVRASAGNGARPRTVMIPYDEHTLVRVDPEARVIVVAPPDGLLD
ncbi:MAG TPA: ribosome maturation factor RimM, partial [Gemmatimonadaceae bacterium]|nr:ribosome maturation factor RimM [Gemmatimonadaceae bacterium]